MTQPEPGAAILARVAALGPFFAFETHHVDAGRPAEPWRAMGELLDDPAVLRDRVAFVREYLAMAGGQPSAAVELRVAASVAQLGLVARLVSPLFAVAVLAGALFRYGLREARWQPAPGGTFPLSLPARAPVPVADPAELADRVAAELLDGPIGQVVAATGSFSLSPHIRWGNVASAVAGAAAAVARSSPELAEQAREFAGLLLARIPLCGAGVLTDDGSGFRRRSCCLIYRAAPDHAGALCGDCVLAARPDLSELPK
jgi:hypothetical protein